MSIRTAVLQRYVKVSFYTMREFQYGKFCSVFRFRYRH
jgi:hypothetical protein